MQNFQSSLNRYTRNTIYKEQLLDTIHVLSFSLGEASRVHAVMPAGMATAPPGRQANPVTRGALQPSIRGRGNLDVFNVSLKY